MMMPRPLNEQLTVAGGRPPDRLPGNVFVGRSEEMAQLRAGLDSAVRGRGRTFLISGEPGIGKTRLAEEFALAASGIGAASGVADRARRPAA